ncbi:MAG: hypothetical protein FWC95_03595 [Defluviitaleaceae bacterium]|nr:hypothetical protein [Defluviitaleaceae bacterium]
MQDNREVKPKRFYYDGASVVLTIGVVALLVFIIYHSIIYAMRERIDQFTIIMGTVEPMTVFSGVIVRAESVYTSNASGVVSYHVQNFARVRAGGVAASIRDASATTYMEQLLAGEDAMFRERRAGNLNPVTENELRTVDHRIASTIDSVAVSIGMGDMDALNELAHRLDQLFETRNRIILNDERLGSSANIASGQERLGRAVSEIRVRSSGIISYKVDGFESIFTIDRLPNLTREETLISIDYLNIPIPSAVVPGDAVFKVITSNDWYIAAYLPIAQVEGWLAGTMRTIYIEGGTGIFTPISVRVHILSRDVISGYAYTVFHIDNRIAEFMDRRSVSFRVRDGIDRGFMIPLSAIVETEMLLVPAESVFTREGREQVLRFNNMTGDFEVVEISVLQRSAGFVSVVVKYNDLSIGDVLAVIDEHNEFRSVTDSERVFGVYVTNTGVAVFRRVNLPNNELDALSYIVIDPRTNATLRLHDRIARYAEQVTDGQLIH